MLPCCLFIFYWGVSTFNYFFRACGVLTRIYEKLLHLSLSVFHKDSSISIFYFLLAVMKSRDNQWQKNPSWFSLLYLFLLASSRISFSRYSFFSCTSTFFFRIKFNSRPPPRCVLICFFSQIIFEEKRNPNKPSFSFLRQRILKEPIFLKLSFERNWNVSRNASIHCRKLQQIWPAGNGTRIFLENTKQKWRTRKTLFMRLRWREWRDFFPMFFFLSFSFAGDDDHCECGVQISEENKANKKNKIKQNKSFQI